MTLETWRQIYFPRMRDFITLGAVQRSAEDYYVSPTGGGDGLHPDRPTTWATLFTDEDVDNLVTPGNRVHLMPGEYAGPLSITVDGSAAFPVVFSEYTDGTVTITTDPPSWSKFNTNGNDGIDTSAFETNKLWFFSVASFQVAGDDTKYIAQMDAALAEGYTGVVFAFDWWAYIEQWSTASKVRMTAIREHAREIGMTFVLSFLHTGTYTDNYYADGASAEVLAEGFPATEMRFIVQGDGTIIPDPDELGTRFNVEGIPAGETNVAAGAVWSKLVTEPTQNTYVHGSMRIKFSADYGASEARVRCIGQRTIDGVNTNVFWWWHDLADTGTDWEEVDFAFTIPDCEKFYFQIVSNGSVGSLDFDSLAFEPGGLVNVLRRDNTPFVMTSEDGLTTYEEGTDFSAVSDPLIRVAQPYGSIWHASPEMTTVGAALSEDDVVLCSYYHVGFHNNTWEVCLSDPAYRARLAVIAAALRDQFDPDEYFMYIEEIRLSGWDPACTDLGTQGEQLADLVADAAAILRAADPTKPISTWSDMFDPYHNARATTAMYVNEGSFYGSWLGLDQGIGIVNWNRQTTLVDEDDVADEDGQERWKWGLAHFAGIGNRQILAGFYDDDYDEDFEAAWVTYAQDYGYFGGMYTTWYADYDYLEDYAAVVVAAED